MNIVVTDMVQDQADRLSALESTRQELVELQTELKVSNHDLLHPKIRDVLNDNGYTSMHDVAYAYQENPQAFTRLKRFTKSMMAELHSYLVINEFVQEAAIVLVETDE